MIGTLIVVLIVLWLLGMFGPVSLPAAAALGGVNLLHTLLVIVLILVVLKLIGRV